MSSCWTSLSGSGFPSLSLIHISLPGIIGRYLMMLKVTDILDIAIMVFVFYKALTLIQSTRAASLLKGVLVFLAALMLSMVLNMNSINFIMNQLVRWGVVARCV